MLVMMFCEYLKLAKTRVMMQFSRKLYNEGLTLVTADKDFGDLIFVFDRSHPTIIRLVDIPARNQGKTLLRLIETHRSDIEKRALITVDRFRVLVRMPDRDKI